ncbi:MAG: 6,7-dimethyl-8-ribityllumazine synthase [Planctomycetes bacterium]|nr:6,7-dimethyl-8-ribityllumazine synthase [Planctomycetota bacterium]MBL7008926.1 6,7-dimethyl-8-ribityllumazine synthase [Planctomycetota bacterium]
MTTLLEGQISGAGRNIAVAVAEFNADITSALLDGCLQALAEHGLTGDAVTVARAPGAFELPLVCDALAASGRYSAVIALGAVIRGETPHFDYVAGECARGVMRVMLDRKLPVVFGVLTTDNLDQARRRADRGVLAGSDQGGERRSEKAAPVSNKGAEAAEVALRMASLLEQI